MREEITTQIARDELLGLLDASAGTAQRVTAQMPAVSEDELFSTEPAPTDEELSGGFVVRFHVKPQTKPWTQRYVVIAASFILTLGAGIGLAAIIM